ncbi:EexN family lipoprotein [uncultured Campylobacter sp.]|uniref:EexN family lipoprotein n=1 Tax=uncultured Campylobacter sp. TaxID=218934 RepID=UPI0028EEDE31|nr:EexN family lipoprotein [uncultured Campylobacter sp.]
MKRIFLLSLTAIVGLGLTGCKEDEPKKTVADYLLAPLEAKAKLELCEKMQPKDVINDKECNNASEAKKYLAHMNGLLDGKWYEVDYFIKHPEQISEDLKK